MSTPFLVIPWIAASLLAQASPTPADPAAERLAVMKDSVKGYEFARDAGPIALRTDPAFRLGNQSNGVLEGAIFLWLDAVGRPEAAAQVFLHREPGHPEGKWLHEFTSLSTATFVARRAGVDRWVPDAPGVAFRPVPGAPKPAPGASARLRQMRALAGQFRAEDDFGGEGRITALRLLPTPIARYGKSGATPEDGALFAFVVGTDPEVFLFLEVRPGPDGPAWHFACAPMSCWPLKAFHEDRKVWEEPARVPPSDPTKPFYCLMYQP